MTATEPRTSSPGVVLAAECAADMMADNPVSLRADASVSEALLLFTQRGIGAAPVIDDAGHPIGVLSRSDILIHEHELLRQPDRAERKAEPSVPSADKPATTVRELMTPAVFSIRPDTPASQVVNEMLALNVHRLFVVDGGVVVGVISALDILKQLRP